MTTPATAAPQRTPLYEAHRALGAKLIDFGGWMMPVSYPAGIVDEHRATRSAIGLFDVSHMGEIHFRGPRAAQAVQRLVANDVGRLIDGGALYSVACRENGGIVDDLIVYRFAPDHFLLVVNASNIGKDFAWFVDNVGSLCDVTDASAETALIAFQGPAAVAAMAGLTSGPVHAAVEKLPRMSFLPKVTLAGRAVTIARTGYTGEDGVEIFCAPDDAPALWNALLEIATPKGGKPVGLGARDTLRLEARLPLYGNDLDDTTTPLEAGLGWTVKLEAGDFIGKATLARQKAAGPTRKLAGFVMLGRGIARHGYAITDSDAADAATVGTVTSGSYCPTVDKNVGLGYVPSALAEEGQRLSIDCRGRRVEAQIVKGPFYRKP